MKDSNVFLDSLLGLLQEAVVAKDLLDEILSYYEVYSGQFREIPDYQADYAYKRSDGSYVENSLNKKIRNYIKFDDSE